MHDFNSISSNTTQLGNPSHHSRSSSPTDSANPISTPKVKKTSSNSSRSRRDLELNPDNQTFPQWGGSNVDGPLDAAWKTAVRQPGHDPQPLQTTQARSRAEEALGDSNERMLPKMSHRFDDGIATQSAVHQPPSKRLRLLHENDRKIDPGTFAQGSLPSEASPPSPLFFSHSPRSRPPLPPRFSSAEAAARMLASTSDESSPAITTLRLPRATSRSSLTPTPSNRSLEGSRTQSAGSHVGINPESMERRTGLQILAEVDILELLDQDDRPTFILDLEDHLNPDSNSLHILFANSALRAIPGLLESIAGEFPQDSDGFSSPRELPTLTKWTTSIGRDGEMTSLSKKAVEFNGLSWTSIILRQRFRLMRAKASNTNIPTAPDLSLNDVVGPPVPVKCGLGITSPAGMYHRHPSTRMTKGLDYFSGIPTHGTMVADASPISRGFKSCHTDGLDEPSDIVPGLTPDVMVKITEDMATLRDPGPASVVLRSSSPADNEVVHSEDNLGHLQKIFSTSDAHGNAFFDWTRMPNSAGLPEHVQFARSVDWASTSLGPIEYWPSALRVMCNFIMASPHATAMYWGPDFIAIYNEAYVALAGAKHPKLMGQSYKEAWSEIWDEVAHTFADARFNGQSTMKEDDCLFLRRSGFLEETYFSWSIIPVVGEDGTCCGLLNPAFEKTRRKIAERRMFTLREVGECLATARDLKGFWGQVLRGLESNAYDAPFVILYSISDENESDNASENSNSVMDSRRCLLEGTLGVPEGHHAAPKELDLRNCLDGFGRHFREAGTTEKPILLSLRDGTVSEGLLDGLEWRGFDDPCSSVVICPIHPTTGDAVLGFFVMGINPRRPYDADYKLFVQLLTRQLATSMASVVLFEEEIKRGQRAAQLAAMDRIELSQQLAARTQEAVESDTRFTRMAELAPVGIFMADGEGHMTYFNEAWYEITRHPKEENNADRWLESIKDDDRHRATEMWRRVVEDKVSVTAEFRFKAPWETRNGAKGDTWVLASAYPEKAEDGSLKSIFGSLTNISQQKWAEDIQKRRMEEAVELKRQQENFIDITSHEMRNPLSAILQCADEISSSLSEYRETAGVGAGSLLAETVESNIDAAQTIALCAQHQKRIVDDVLTLSKLDSALILVTPVDAQPVAVVQRALRMFEGELQTNDIAMEFQVLDSYTALGVDWVRLDPSRLMQVLINLTTNAIKFTHAREKRTILVSIGASMERPSRTPNTDVAYFSTRSEAHDPTTGADWGTGESIFLSFAVRDTGRGLDEKERKLLFLRFSQASPRTHVQYGGSGLGLFISRELTELQGGEIGVSSESGKGSTFAFYIRARRSPVQATANVAYPLPLEPENHFFSQRKRVLSTGPAPSDGAVVSRLKERKRSDIKVLVVEDNLVNQRVLSKQLRNLGCVVHLANHGGECLERLRESRLWKGREEDGFELSLILMDLEMPVMNGLTCTEEIRKKQREGCIVQHVPIIAVTANARSEQIQTALNAGMDDVVSKPFRIPELIPKMEELTMRYGKGGSDSKAEAGSSHYPRARARSTPRVLAARMET